MMTDRRFAGAGLVRRDGARGADILTFHVNAGPDAEFSAGTLQLSGAGAYNGVAPYTYLWAVASGGAGTFDNATALAAVFTPTDAAVPSILRLTATDATTATAVDTLSVCGPLVCAAGSDDSVEPATPLALAGSATAGIAPRTYLWVQTSGAGMATFTDATDPETDVEFDLDDDYVLTLTVTDSRKLSDADTVTITVAEAP
jgi:hypothetical protein